MRHLETAPAKEQRGKRGRVTTGLRGREAVARRRAFSRDVDAPGSQRLAIVGVAHFVLISIIYKHHCALIGS